MPLDPRGLFDCRGGKCCVFFVFVRYTSFDIETARLDDKFPNGDTLYDRLCSVAFQMVTVKNVSQPDKYQNVKTVILIYVREGFDLNSDITTDAEIIFAKMKKSY